MTSTTTTAPVPLLRLALRLDAVVTGLNGAGYLLAAGPVGDLLGLPAGWLRGAGAFLLAYAVAVWVVADRPAAPAVRAVIAGNALWAAGSLAVALTGAGTPTTTGTAWIVLQAAVVAAFAAAQAAGLRRR
ncbi:hypothetical protein [Geodermatophilus marinus]|uniref:hypothetical protein n=1 Tax=Geodermatophilus sp. LHW52908 TaxID=2303986 RepID=UPI000E3EB844|nr:hypothetical protein [Geodermatophilus sp. LHW52908]RFU20213.1 hypothetical protein D0Z06_17230 [Geodermatophilus sp. LHW52908]